MATAIWLLEKCPKDDQQKAPPIVVALFRAFSLVFALFRTFSHFSARFRTFWAVCFWSFWPSVFALFRTVRLLPFSGYHLHSTEFSPPGDRATLSKFWGAFLTKKHRKPGEEEKHPLEKVQKKLQISVDCHGGMYPDQDRAFGLFQKSYHWVEIPSFLIPESFFLTVAVAVWSAWKSEVKLSPPRERPLKNSLTLVSLCEILQEADRVGEARGSSSGSLPLAL